MAQTEALLETLKKQLRASGVTYADVAQALQLSEASVKRLFAQQDFTLARLEVVCQLVGMDLADLVAASQRQQRQVEQLTEVQEAEIADDPLLLLIAVSVINGFSFTDLVEHYQLSGTDCVRKLAQLDRLKLIDLMPGNRIKLRIAPNFRWSTNGPIQRFFLQYVQKDFFDSRFDTAQEKLLVVNGLISHTGNAALQEKMETLSLEFHDQMQRDKRLPMADRHGTTMIIAIRQWRFSLFEPYARK